MLGTSKACLGASVCQCPGIFPFEDVCLITGPTVITFTLTLRAGRITITFQYVRLKQHTHFAPMVIHPSKAVWNMHYLGGYFTLKSKTSLTPQPEYTFV